jgi:hypothetical protein
MEELGGERRPIGLVIGASIGMIEHIPNVAGLSCALADNGERRAVQQSDAQTGRA